MKCRGLLWYLLPFLVLALWVGWVGATDAQAGTPITATLTWVDNSNNELGFRIERKSDPAGCSGAVPFVEIATVGAGVVTYIDSTLLPSTPYCYRVRAWNTVDGTAGGIVQFSVGYAGPAYYPFVIPASPTGLGVVAGP
jgi:hypothetical protein